MKNDIEDRYYTPKEYDSLSDKQKEKLRKIRQKRERQVAAAITELADVKKQLAELKKNTPAEQPTNRTNPALTRRNDKQE